MTARDIVMSSAGTGTDKTYIEDVFSTYLYTGNSSTQTITNGIDLAGKGGMVWQKVRGSAGYDHVLTDTITSGTGSLTNFLSSNSTNPFSQANILGSYNSNGFTLNSGSGYNNVNGVTAVSWTFRKAPKFFDVVTYTGNGVQGRSLAHSLGVEPGMMIVKKLNGTGRWVVYHRSAYYPSNYPFPETGALFLNTTDAWAYYGGAWGNTAPTASDFRVGNNNEVNGDGNQYVAYLFAHDTTTDGLIQCGSFTSDGSTPNTITLGWEPQYVLIKATNANADWQVADSMRGLTANNGIQPTLRPDTTGSEGNAWSVIPTATGFQWPAPGDAGNSYIYMAIRRGPMKTPTDGTKVFSISTLTSESTSTHMYAGANFPPDLVIHKPRITLSSYPFYWDDRLRGSNLSLSSASTSTEQASPGSIVPPWNFNASEDAQIAAGAYFNNNGEGAIAPSVRSFKRAPGFFDMVCYTGTGSSNTQAHNLGAVPELMIIKNRSSAGDNWFAGCLFDDVSVFPNFQSLLLNTSGAAGYQSYGGGILNSKPTESSFALGSAGMVNRSSNTYVAYLFASCPGVSKVGSYTGNGSSQTINCGFTNGARFVLIKRTDSAGDWYVLDTARGIVAGNDPYLSLNTTAAEVTTDDTIDPDSTGFIVNQVSATNVNVSGGSYIYLAIA